VIDYRVTRFVAAVSDVDVVFDTMGGDTQERSWKVLKRGGILVSIVQPVSQEKAAAHGVRGAFFRQNPRGDQLAQIADLVAKGRVKVHIEQVFSLTDGERPRSQKGHTRGKIVLRMD
jgi:NADPH:quinone reductase-like Zn-dependent oxidoreductase